MPAAGIRSLQPNEINTVISACVGLGNGVLLRHNAQETRWGDAGSNRTLESLVGQCLDRVVTAYLQQTCMYVMSVNWSLWRYLCQIKKKFRNLGSGGLWLFLTRVCVCGNVIEFSIVNTCCAVVIVIQMYVYQGESHQNCQEIFRSFFTTKEKSGSFICIMIIKPIFRTIKIFLLCDMTSKDIFSPPRTSRLR